MLYEEFGKALLLQQEVGLYQHLKNRRGGIHILMREIWTPPRLEWVF